MAHASMFTAIFVPLGDLGAILMRALGYPNLIASAYPLVLIPAFGVPLFIVLHGLALWRLRREALRSPAHTLIAQPA